MSSSTENFIKLRKQPTKSLTGCGPTIVGNATISYSESVEAYSKSITPVDGKATTDDEGYLRPIRPDL